MPLLPVGPMISAKWRQVRTPLIEWCKIWTHSTKPSNKVELEIQIQKCPCSLEVIQCSQNWSLDLLGLNLDISEKKIDDVKPVRLFTWHSFPSSSARFYSSLVEVLILQFWFSGWARLPLHLGPRALAPQATIYTAPSSTDAQCTMGLFKCIVSDLFFYNNQKSATSVFVILPLQF